MKSQPYSVENSVEVIVIDCPTRIWQYSLLP